ncbi:hypothetical protein ACN5TA_002710 [Bacillus cytotoxicus]|nr:hypothetical protein [Bacillus cytotoxicus]MDH2881452.1 hypothetical protein [Bacillus cytotoxicus]
MNHVEKYVTSQIYEKGRLPYIIQHVQSRQNIRLLDITIGGGHVANELALDLIGKV